MQFSEWEPVYTEILRDMRYDRTSDEASARLLRALMVNGDLAGDDELESIVGPVVTVTGGADSLSGILDSRRPRGTVIAAGSSAAVLMEHSIIPDIVVTDLDGDIEAQKRASAAGAVTVVHAHGDNTEAIMLHIKDFKGKIVLSTQSAPDTVLTNYGGFTDGDRAVCLARHFGAEEIDLMGFDFGRPAVKEGSDPGLKLKKLHWAYRIIMGMNPSNVRVSLINT